MKATGIVLRIDARVIITPRAIKPHKHWVFHWFCPKYFEKTSGFGLGLLLKRGVEIHSKEPDGHRCSSGFVINKI